MHLSLPTLALAALYLNGVLAKPLHSLHHRKHRRDNEYAGVNWNDPSLYKNVDWNTVNYGGGSTPASPTTSPAAPASTPAQAAPVVEAEASPSHSSSPVVKQDSATSNSNSGSTTSSSGKRGLAYNPSSGNLDIWSSYDTISWGFNWDDTPQGLPSKFQYVPTLWGTASVHSGNWDSAVKAATSSGSSGPTYLMSFNEPDNQGQANMDVASAVAAFNQYMKPYASDSVLLGSPSVTNGAGNNGAGIPMGIDWLSPFLQQCTGCPVSFASIHWYGCQNGCSVADDVSDFQSHVQSAIEAAVNPATGDKVPVWVTEFQSFTDPATFLGEVLPWLDGESGVQRYAYFMATDGIMISGGSVNAVGAKYAS